jgi:adhesin/invasin
MRTMAALFLLASCGEVQGDMPVDGSTTDTPGDDAAPDVDAPPAACGDGNRDPGEACFGTPISLDGGDAAFDAQLADIDGDGDLDVVFSSDTQVSFFAQQGGTFATTISNGPASTAATLRIANLGGDARLEVITGDVGGISTWQTSGTSTAYATTFAATEAGVKTAGVELASVTGAAIPDVVSVYGDKIFVGTYNTSLVLTNTSNRSVVKISSLATGALDGDNLADVAIAGVNGIVAFRGTAAGLDIVADTPHDELASAVAIGDVDADGVGDIVFTRSGTSGYIGWMRGLSNMTFAPAVTKAVPDIGNDLVIADIDGDGHPDAVSGRVRGTLAVLVFHGKADGTLADPVELAYPFTILSSISAKADYTGDGVVDIVTTSANTGEIAVYPSTP